MVRVARKDYIAAFEAKAIYWAENKTFCNYESFTLISIYGAQIYKKYIWISL